MTEVRPRLSKKEAKQLQQLLENEHFSLLYKGSVHGYTVASFHAKCDVQGPSLVVAYNNSGFVFGGYSSRGFSSSNQHIKDEKAFLFSLNKGETQDRPLKIPVKNADQAVNDMNDQGPNFGTGSLCFLINGADATTTQNNNYCEFDLAEFHGNDTALVECEVYRVEGIGNILESPWRKLTWTPEERSNLMEFIRNYKTCLNPVSQVRILMIGPVGAGKSSFFNSVNSVFRGHVTCQAIAGSDSTSVTKKYRTYALKDGKAGKLLPIILCDSMGLEEKTGAGLEVEDVPKLLQGHVPDRYTFNAAASIQPDFPGYLMSPSLKDKVHCVVFVIDACKVSILSANLVEKLRRLRTTVNQCDVPNVLLLTKVDELCPIVAEDICEVYRSRAVQKQVHTASAHLGIPVSNILPIKSYSSSLELDYDSDILILHAVQQMLRYADNYFDNISFASND
ncbi:interferon-induced protein 44-like [Microcaecilia unicolor]|uniref:Interferon-induced protein 44-like n=1 Tax=Microcaecilia unicolor TaxID=1415580 RepID=A0A6P7YJM4_9AMPH|nr:interferon-induced protein 44-like [Microcaecilia unicolor]XP_030063159.1 interferon-induced protein 44-like [Microcaecilia unicolor]